MSRRDSFFPAPRALTLEETVQISGARLVRGDGKIAITGIAPLETAGNGDLTFLENAKYVKHLAATQASACLCSKRFMDRVPDHVAILETAQPYQGYAAVLAHVFPDAMRPSGVLGDSGPLLSENAFVDPSANLEKGVKVEPGAVIGAGASVGRNTVISAGVSIAANVSIGRDCSVGSNSTLQHSILGDRVIIHPGCQIGQDGFGFAMSPTGHRKVPQIGRVIIQDDVEIGANSCIDRGANRDTVVGEGTKIDNQVQIGHNVEIGRHCVIVAQVGISGSSRLGDFVVIGGQAGVSGHVEIGDGAQIAGTSAVHARVRPGERVGGIPARPIEDLFRELTMLRRLSRRENVRKNQSDDDQDV